MCLAESAKGSKVDRRDDLRVVRPSEVVSDPVSCIVIARSPLSGTTKLPRPKADSLTFSWIATARFAHLAMTIWEFDRARARYPGFGRASGSETALHLTPVATFA